MCASLLYHLSALLAIVDMCIDRPSISDYPGHLIVERVDFAGHQNALCAPSHGGYKANGRPKETPDLCVA